MCTHTNSLRHTGFFQKRGNVLRGHRKHPRNRIDYLPNSRKTVFARAPSKIPTGLLGPDHHLLCLDVSLLVAIGYFILGLYLQCSPLLTVVTWLPPPWL